MKNNFFKNLSWSFFGGVGASAIMMAINIFVGRLLGPTEYGKYSLVISLSQIIIIPIVFGLDISAVRAIATSTNEQEKRRNISAALYFTVVASLAIGFVVYMLRFQIAHIMNAPQEVVLIALAFAIIIALKTIADAVMRGLEMFRYQFIARVIEVATICFFFFLFFFGWKMVSFESYVWVLGIGALGPVILYFNRIRFFFSRLHAPTLRNQIAFSSIIVVGTLLGTAFNSLDKLALARYASLYELGVYGAYFTASTNLIAQLTQAFLNVFFPMIAKYKDKRDIILRVNRYSKILFIPIFFALSIAIFIIMKLFGTAYELRYLYITLFAFLGTLQIILTINASIITSVSRALFQNYTWYINAIAVCFVGVYMALIKYNAISIMTVCVLIISFVCVGILLQKFLLARWLNRSSLNI
ncbi:MAG: oligosaccharide flippase family protein [Candidatus Andersenbacteria bacterium]